MLLTLFLLGLVYAVLIAVLIAAGAGAVTIAIVAAALFAVQLLHLGQDRAALDGRPRGHPGRQHRRSCTRSIERLCVQANLPKPRVAIAADADAERVRGRPLARRPPPCARPPGSSSCLDPAELEARARPRDHPRP